MESYRVTEIICQNGKVGNLYANLNGYFIFFFILADASDIHVDLGVYFKLFHNGRGVYLPKKSLITIIINDP